MCLTVVRVPNTESERFGRSVLKALHFMDRRDPRWTTPFQSYVISESGWLIASRPLSPDCFVEPGAMLFGEVVHSLSDARQFKLEGFECLVEAWALDITALGNNYDVGSKALFIPSMCDDRTTRDDTLWHLKYARSQFEHMMCQINLPLKTRAITAWGIILNSIEYPSVRRIAAENLRRLKAED